MGFNSGTEPSAHAVPWVRYSCSPPSDDARERGNRKVDCRALETSLKFLFADHTPEGQ
jgi:hypothetical protein